jgi:hypothetical protein
VEGFCEHGIEPSGSIKCWEVLEELHNLRLLKKGSAPLVFKLELMTLFVTEDYRRTASKLKTTGVQRQMIRR